MDENKKKKLIKVLVALGTALVAAIAVFVWRLNNPPSDLGSMPVMQALSDGFFVVGLLLLGFGILMWVSTTGVLDIITYGFKSLIYLFTPFQKERGTGGFYEYKLEKKEKRKAVPFEYLWIGAGMLILSFIFALFA